MTKGILALLMLCASLCCSANDYYYQPIFNSNQRYASNLFMRPVPLQDNWITTVSPGINLGLRHEKGELKSNFTWNELIYDNQSELNVAEQLFSADYQHKGERIQWNLGGSYNNQSSVNTESKISGLVFSQVMRKQLSLAPSVTYSFNELSSVTSNYSFTKATYDKVNNLQGNVSFSDYDYHVASSTFNHLYTNRDKLNGTLSSSLYQTSSQNSQTTYNNVAQIGWQHSFSEQLITYASVGINYSIVETKFSQGLMQTKNNFGQVYSASIQKSFEKGSISLAGSKNQSPTSIGLQTQTSISINPSYSITERWTSGISASYNKSEMTGVSTSTNNRTFYSISHNVNWKCTPEINMGLSYTYQQSEYQGSTQSSLGNIAQIQFSYQPQINNQVK